MIATDVFTQALQIFCWVALGLGVSLGASLVLGALLRDPGLPSMDSEREPVAQPRHFEVIVEPIDWERQGWA